MIKDIKFQKLTPSIVDDMKGYEEAIDFVFEKDNDDLLNIAVSGAYSAGKSSVLKTYAKKRGKKFIHISLAHFGSLTPAKRVAEDGSKTTVNYETVLEGKILNQLIHQIDPKKIPDTHFKIKRNKDDKETKKITKKIVFFILTLAYILLFFRFIDFSEIGNIKLNFGFKENIFTYPLFVLRYFEMLLLFAKWKMVILVTKIIKIGLLGLLLLAIVTLIKLTKDLIFNIVKTLKNNKIIKKLNINGIGIEIFDSKNESYFDKYLNEVLYVFERANVNGIVFEDIDRYNNKQIFSKLREINYLVNKSSEKKGKKNETKKLRFFYLIRDEIFDNKDRTKFFDFIIPIVPYIDSSNSCDKFLELFQNAGIKEKFEQNFLEKISFYVDDMRILSNIYNEFFIYYERLITKLKIEDYNKLLAMIIYKNIFPKDFGDFQLNSGYVQEIFNCKSYYVELRTIEIDNKIKEIIDRGVSSEDETVVKLRKQKINLPDDDLKDLITDDIADTVFGLKDKYTYEKCKKLIEEVDDIAYQKSKTAHDVFGELIENENFELMKNYNKIMDNQYFPLIQFLIEDGKIDETYSDYITYFYPNRILPQDRLYIIGEKRGEFEYKLEEPHKVIDKLVKRDFKRERTLNFSMLSYLLQENHDFLKVMIANIVENNRVDFLTSYIEKDNNADKLINKTYKQYSTWDIILDESNEHYYMLYILCFTDDDDLVKLNKKDEISEYVLSQKEFANINKNEWCIKPELFDKHISTLIEKLKLLEIKFANLNYENINEEFLDMVYKSDMYEINWDFISLFLTVKYGITYKNTNGRSNQDLINSKPDEPLAIYVNNNLEEYLIEMLENVGEPISDCENTAISVLNSDDANVKLEIRKQYLMKLSTKITKLSMINDLVLKKELVMEKKIAYSIENIVDSFFVLDEVQREKWVDFVNSDGKTLAFKKGKVFSEDDKDKKNAFYNYIIKNNQIEDKTYRMLMDGYDNDFDKATIPELLLSKVAILIELKIITMVSANLDFIRADYTDNLEKFITLNVFEYIKIFNDARMLPGEDHYVLSHDKVSDKAKKEFIDKINKPISITDRGYEPNIIIHILNNNFDIKDISYIIEKYPTQDPSVNEKIIAKIAEHVQPVLSGNYIFAVALLYKLINHDELSPDDRKHLFANSLYKLKKPQISSVLSKLKLIDFERMLNRGRPTVEQNIINDKILKYFKEKGWISKYTPTVNDPGYYNVIGTGKFHKNPFFEKK